MKVIGIGLPRTGLTSLARALTILGYDTIHFPASLERAQRREAATDMPLPHRYRALAKRFPKAKFILTLREERYWHRSMVAAGHKYGWIDHPDPKLRKLSKHAQERTKKSCPEVYEAFNKTLGRDPARWVERYHFHRQQITKNFQLDPDRLLIMNICDGDRWIPLCRFLNKDIPEVDFPWRHRIASDG